MKIKTEDWIPPNKVARNAAKGLRLRNKFKRGGTEVGFARARQLKKQEVLTLSVIKRMFSYFSRHSSVDKNAKNFGNDVNPSKGYIAWEWSFFTINIIKML